MVISAWKHPLVASFCCMFVPAGSLLKAKKLQLVFNINFAPLMQGEQYNTLYYSSVKDYEPTKIADFGQIVNYF